MYMAGVQRPALVHLTCLLFNDSDSVITVVPQSQRVLIDGNSYKILTSSMETVLRHSVVGASGDPTRSLSQAEGGTYSDISSIPVTIESRGEAAIQSPTILITFPPDAYRSHGSVNSVR